MNPAGSYLNAGNIDDLKRKGCSKFMFLDRYIMVCYFDGDFIAVDMGSASEILRSRSFPNDFRGQISKLMDSPEETYNSDWGKFTMYPVRIDGDSVLIGSSPIPWNIGR